MMQERMAVVMELIDVKDYVQKTAEIIGSVVELEALICDREYRILGDSKQRSHEPVRKIGDHSVLTAAIARQQVIIMEDTKRDSEGCRFCPERAECDINAMVAIPISRGIHVYGGIGIYAHKKESVRRLIGKNKTFIEFIGRMSELLIAKLDEEQEKASLRERVRSLSNHATSVSFDEIVGSSRGICLAKEEAESIASSSSTVLIQGESGTGKEIFARAIHSSSQRFDGPFVAVNCAAIPDNLLESELFGYEEGAFTGAIKGGRIGKFELANNGTLFLDEVGEIPIHLQPKLLRVLQERRIQKLGSSQDVPVDIRILAATNRDLEEMMKTGAFREDLYYRLNVIPLAIPPLRERRQDIMELCRFFLERYNRSLGKDLKGFEPEAEKVLTEYDWPGNVRELQNGVEYAVNMARGRLIGTDSLPRRLFCAAGEPALTLKPMRQVEEDYIREALRVFGSDAEGKEKAAGVLGLSRATMYRRLKEMEENGAGGAEAPDGGRTFET